MYDQNGGTASSTNTPAGSRSPALRCSRQVAYRANANPAVLSSRPSPTARNAGSSPVTQVASASSHCHRVPVELSALSPTLNTGPLPARICRTGRR